MKKHVIEGILRESWLDGAEILFQKMYPGTQVIFVF